MQIQDIETQIILSHLIFLENKDAKPINYHSNLLIWRTNTSSSIYRIFIQLFHLKSLCFCAFLQRNSEKQKTVIELLRQTLLFKPKISLTKTSTNATNNIKIAKSPILTNYFATKIVINAQISQRYRSWTIESVNRPSDDTTVAVTTEISAWSHNVGNDIASVYPWNVKFRRSDLNQLFQRATPAVAIPRQIPPSALFPKCNRPPRKACKLSPFDWFFKTARKS